MKTRLRYYVRAYNETGYYVVDETGQYMSGVMSYQDALEETFKLSIDDDVVAGYFLKVNKVDLLLALVNRYGDRFHDYIIETINTTYKG